jgi:hypothetical protein
VAFSVVVLGLSLLSITFLEAINGEAQVPDQVGNLATTATLALVTVTIGVAILRYRLYDIDLVINRSLVYGTLTLVLGALFVGGVVGLPMLLPLKKANGLVVAASTLAVAALFSPSAGGSRSSWIGVSTAPATTPSGPSRLSLPASETRRIWRASPVTCRRWYGILSSRQWFRSGLERRTDEGPAGQGLTLRRER